MTVKMTVKMMLKMRVKNEAERDGRDIDWQARSVAESLPNFVRTLLAYCKATNGRPNVLLPDVLAANSLTCIRSGKLKIRRRQNSLSFMLVAVSSKCSLQYAQSN